MEMNKDYRSVDSGMTGGEYVTEAVEGQVLSYDVAGTGEPYESGGGSPDMSHSPEYEEFTPNPSLPGILLIGPRKSGKTSIHRVVFDKKSPHETNWEHETRYLEEKYVANSEYVQFKILDCPGDFEPGGNGAPLRTDEGIMVSERILFQGMSALVLVVDAQEAIIEEPLPKIVTTIRRAYEVNQNLDFEVFIHKVDGDIYISEEHKVDCQRDVQNFITDALNQHDLEVKISYYLTSIYDHSIFEAVSKVIQKLIPPLPTLENMLNCLISNCLMEKSFLFDVVSRVYLATDLNPVDMSSYELCCDMIDVVIDVSCIYGVEHADGAPDDTLAYDERSASVIRMSNGMVLYLKEVGRYLALVCLIRADNFDHKDGIIDYNISRFKETLAKVFERPPLRLLRPRTTAPGTPEGSRVALESGA